MEEIVVIGGINIDICHRVNKKIQYRDSNIGKIDFSLGGVGFNIALNLSKLGLKVNFISSVGDDLWSKYTVKQLLKMGIKPDLIKINQNLTMNFYSYFLDDNHDMLLAINDMKAITNLTIKDLEIKKELLSRAKFVIIDTNLSYQIIKWITDNFANKILVDGVSATKVTKVKEFLNKIHTIKINKNELGALSNTSEIKNSEIPKYLSNLINQKQIANVFVSNGSDGVYFNENQKICKIKNNIDNIVNTTGAGDGLATGIFYSIIQNDNKKNQAINGLKITNLILQSPTSTSNKINSRTLERKK